MVQHSIGCQGLVNYPADVAVAGTRRARRSQDEVLRLLLQTARAQFTEHGYTAAGTRAIAERAGVSESLIFNHFDSKAGLFEAAVLEPFGEFIDEFVAAWIAAPHTTDVERETRFYVTGMYRLFREHRALVANLLAASSFDQRGLEPKITATFARLLTPIEMAVAAEADRRGWTVDVPTLIRAKLGLIISMSVYDHLFYDAPADRPADDHVIDQICRLVIDGYHNLE